MAEEENIIVDLNTRIRVLEERHNTLRERVLIVNQNMVDEYKKLLQEIKTINSDIREIKGDLNSIKDTIRHMIKEMEYFARKDNLKVLEKYINVWNPLNFVTEKDVIRIINERRGEKTGRTANRRSIKSEEARSR